MRNSTRKRDFFTLLRQISIIWYVGYAPRQKCNNREAECRRFLELQNQKIELNCHCGIPRGTNRSIRNPPHFCCVCTTCYALAQF